MTEPVRILMLEDNVYDAELIRRWLQREYRPATFNLCMTEDDFIQALTAFNPQVILADNSMPQFSAAEALDIVRRHFPNLPFIMVTGTVSEEYAAGIIKKGADDYILKSSLVRLPAAIDGAIKFRQTQKEREEALQNLIGSEENYRKLIERITDAFIALDREWRYTFLNQKATELIHKNREEVMGRNVWEVFPDAVGSDTYHAFHRALAEQRYMSNTDYYEPLDLYQENHIYPSPDGLSVFIRNITEKKKLEKKLLEQQRREQLRITEAVLDAQEKERNEIAIELHDNVNQILVGVNMVLSVIRDKPEAAREMISECIGNISHAIEENRKIAHELVSPDLSTENLLQQISRINMQMLNPVGIRTRLVHDNFTEERLHPKQKIAVYRIIQEQYTNIIKHARAKQVEVLLETGLAGFSLQITDDGQGASPEVISAGVGLRNIQSRLSIFEGKSEVQTSPGKGFMIRAWMPLHQPVP
ncbi:MAG: response regulator [Chitinophagaceae bacterium]